MSFLYQKWLMISNILILGWSYPEFKTLYRTQNGSIDRSMLRSVLDQTQQFTMRLVSTRGYLQTQQQ